ncbi:MAG TPA: UDP-N-acetylmuramoyl-L-alanyl-D-glutamate--2,6-diaminopimelate ligase [Gemmatimonadaceae bacterium]|nr:UDP-N-acetylmuramoyl-L-alanyl-D-glutamate--2,6-diaminopimelate ligase [Gemmatimonadaceae bacterium]
MNIPVGRVQDALEKEGLLVESRGAIPEFASGISDDSRVLEAGGIFVAVRGSERDGHEYLDAAHGRGAGLAIVEDASRTSLPALVVREGRRAAAVAAGAAYNHPARDLTMLAVTGTNGKTTTTSIMRHLLSKPGRPAASIGTLGVLTGSAGEVVPGGGGLTTPGPVELQRVLRDLSDRGVRHVAMEVSSHSLDQRRIDGLVFDVAVFTNLTRDHLDYHGTMDAYLAAKARLVDYVSEDGTVVVNRDAPEWRGLRQRGVTVTFAIANEADVRAKSIRYTTRGSEWRLVTREAAADVLLPLLGDVNVQNALAAAATAIALGDAPAQVAASLAGVPQTPGRLEIISRSPAVLRDYAHTPDALERSLRTARAFTTGRLIVVFGCGGDRDKGKRPIMGRIAEQGADLAIVTSDNPRTEDPDAIVREIEAGMKDGNHERVTDRLAAIGRALTLAGDGDLVLLAGKGHETYQIRGTTSHPFDEKEIVRELTAGRS